MTLEILTSDSISQVRHGFFTRKGGVSSGIYAGLNCGYGSSDLTENVAVNRDLAAQAMKVESENLITVHQIHSSNVVTADSPFENSPQADGMSTNKPGMALAVLTADCLPVLFADMSAGVIGAAHAGWRGALDGVLEATVAAMENQGATARNIHAAIGPCISQAAYEVGFEFLDRFLDASPDYNHYFINGESGRYFFDLPAFAIGRLRNAGIGEVEWIRHCTYEEADRFYSYRRATHNGDADYGRLISVIAL
ncbi:MAG: peptidoglycan editing factor PgeF [Roseovarius sp.]|nr:peptidoglycan editing factor PgeF [Roseovarius sp.]